MLIDPYGDGEVAGSANYAKKSIEIYKTLEKELVDFGRDVDKKHKIVAINKLDITEVKSAFDDIKKAFKKLKLDVVCISAVTGEGLESLKELFIIKLALEDSGKKDTNKVFGVVKSYNMSNLPNKRVIFGNVRELEIRM